VQKFIKKPKKILRHWFLYIKNIGLDPALPMLKDSLFSRVRDLIKALMQLFDCYKKQLKIQAGNRLLLKEKAPDHSGTVRRVF
jgi:hypothetical protein